MVTKNRRAGGGVSLMAMKVSPPTISIGSDSDWYRFVHFQGMETSRWQTIPYKVIAV
jgi:hypothetical protein